MCPVDINVSFLGLLFDNKWKRKVTQLCWATPLLPTPKLLGRLSLSLDTAVSPLLSHTASLLSGTSSEWREVAISIPLIFPTSELRTKLNGNLTFPVTICLIVHLVPSPSAHQVLIPSKNPWIPHALFWGSLLKLKHSLTTHNKADLPLPVRPLGFRAV